MAIQNIPPFPLRSQGLTQAAYSSGVEASLVAIPQMIDDLNAVGSAYALSTNGTSTTSVAIGTGSKSFTTQTGLGYQVGMTLRLAFDSVNYMTGDVTSYNTGTGALVVNVTSVVGSGTRTSWVISMAAVGANNAASVSNTPAGNISSTNVQAALNELDAEKLSSADGAVTSAKLASIVTGATVGSASNIPVMTYNAKGQITGTSSAAKISLGTTTAASGSNTIDFTGLSASGKRFTFLCNGLSLSGTDRPLIQLGHSGGFVTTGYAGSGSWTRNAGNPAALTSSSGLIIVTAALAASVFSGKLILEPINLASHIWLMTFIGCETNDANTLSSTAVITLPAALDRVRFTTNGSNTYDTTGAATITPITE
jgi:hypothetical protein